MTNPNPPTPLDESAKMLDTLTSEMIDRLVLVARMEAGERNSPRAKTYTGKVADELRSRIRELVEEARTTPASHANAEQRIRELEAFINDPKVGDCIETTRGRP